MRKTPPFATRAPMPPVTVATSRSAYAGQYAFTFPLEAPHGYMVLEIDGIEIDAIPYERGFQCDAAYGYIDHVCQLLGNPNSNSPAYETMYDTVVTVLFRLRSQFTMGSKVATCNEVTATVIPFSPGTFKRLVSQNSAPKI